MKVRILTAISIILAVYGVESSEAIANEDASAEPREIYRKLKQEQREEHRELRRKHRAQGMLMRVDENKDGQVDLNEYLAHAQERFNKLDLDGNGFVTPDEAKESMKQLRDEHKERRKEMRKKRSEERQD